MISVLDYGIGNVKSVTRMIEKVGGSTETVSTPESLLNVEKLIIPGVGSFDSGMKKLISGNFIPALNKIALERGIPVLGICLGMQLMCQSSEEGVMPGLSWIDASVERFPETSSTGLRIPHMGWNTLKVLRPNALLPFNSKELRFYFVHSFRVNCHNSSDSIATTDYGINFIAAFQKGNLFGAQFHPEKSHRFGMDLIRRFMAYNNA